MGDISSTCCDSKGIGQQIGEKIIYNNHEVSPLKLEIPITVPKISEQMGSILDQGKSTVYFKKNQTAKSNFKLIKLKNKQHQAIYQGEIQNNYAQGYGKLYFANGKLFEGTFVNGQPINGVFALNQKSFYVGDIKNYQAFGKGLYENIETKYEYEGQWSKNMPHGKGYERFPNGDSYQGGYLFGSKFGDGDYIFKNGTRYFGSFYNGHSDGFGKLTCPNGQSYQGEWKLGEIHGKGIFKWPNGETYQGQYIHGKRHGSGKYKFSNGVIYEGEWKEGVQEGKGQVKEGYDIVQGIWKNGVKLQ